MEGDQNVGRNMFSAFKRFFLFSKGDKKWTSCTLATVMKNRYAVNISDKRFYVVYIVNGDSVALPVRVYFFSESHYITNLWYTKLIKY